MAELSKFVKSRLAQQSSGGQADHLDANLLAAFAEQTLLERERTTVSAHLAQCADCREALALASAGQPVAERATAAPKRHWFPEWRWAGAAAAACCVIAVALQYRVQPPPVVETRNNTVAPPVAAAPAPLPGQPVQQVPSAPKLKAEHLKKALQLPPPPTVAQEQSPPIVMTQVEAGAPERNPAAVVIRPLEPKALRAETADAVRLQKDLIATKAQSGLRPQANVFTQGMIARAPVTAARTVSGVSEPTVLWSINASSGTAGNAHGVVERSLDAGKTWEAAPLSNEVSFRAVASAGTHVWAGGTNGALFHSPDGGAHWEQIAVADDGFKLTGTIVNIDARDANLIKITTSSGEKWFSLDGGGRWKRH
jgi:hypothetical protein